MEGRPARSSPRLLARVGGALYLLIIVLGLFEETAVRQRIIVPADAAATAANLTALESLWRLGVAAELVLLVSAVVLGWILFVLLRPVSRELALLALLFNLVTIAVEAVAALFLLAALFPLGGAGYLAAFEPDQLQAMARTVVRWHGHGFALALVFFGCECIVLGYLIFRSTYLPRPIGVLMQVAGAAYLVNSFALVLAPGFASLLLLMPALVGEGSLALWLLVKGLNVEKWDRVQARQPIGPAPVGALE